MIEIVGMIYRHVGNSKGIIQISYYLLAVGMILSSYILSIQLEGGILILGSVVGICWMIWGKINRKKLLLSYITVTFLMIIYDIITLFASFPLMNKLTVNTWPMKGMYKEFINGLYTIHSSCCNNYPEDVKDSVYFFNIYFNSVNSFQIYVQKEISYIMLLIN